ncbi:hypothetical protein FB562_2214 [Homoserinimonas aerilata]|uniref:Uncharacterized protein n=1 Tax=Homoserinimonas aerilata TaxID=1162970 RepID=A0A542YF42_9MICO|nr:hypothetical protein [Homoserinimonas aerilata]TQL46690.1 hypothetical protein FB562_2214 [Homoserinimonas aerilata]
MRVIVACINWNHPDAPHAVSYVLRDGEAIASVYHDTWAEAMHRANELAARLKAVAS